MTLRKSDPVQSVQIQITVVRIYSIRCNFDILFIVIKQRLNNYMLEFQSQVDSVDSDGDNLLVALSNLEGNVSFYKIDI